MKHRLILLLLASAVCSCSPNSTGEAAPQDQERPAVVASAAPASAAATTTERTPVKPLTLEGVGNLYQVSPDLYRSGQPKPKGFKALYNHGIRSVLNLREYHNDDKKAAGSGLTLYHHRMAAGGMTESDIEQCLLVLRHAPKPVLVHCMHGSDRTGTIVAAYRIVEQGWSVDDALAELQEKRFGYHAFWYPSIPKLLRSIDWEAMRARLDAPAN